MFFKKTPTTNNHQPSTLLIGLGNPGADYAGNRHNVGFMAVERVAAEHGFSGWSKKFGGLICEGTIGGHKLFAFKPQSYMNLSGEPVAKAAGFYKIPVERLVVVHDELDLPPTKIRVKRGGGAGGHNGLKSIDAHLGKDYIRVRFGIGHPGDKDAVSDYVLSDFAKAERASVADTINDISRHIALLLAGDEAGFMNKVKKGNEDGTH